MVFLGLFKESFKNNKREEKQSVLSNRMQFNTNIYTVFTLVLCHQLLSYSVAGENNFSNPNAPSNTPVRSERYAEEWHLPQCFQDKIFNLVFLYDVNAVELQRNQLGSVIEFFENVIQVLDVRKQKNEVTLISFDSQVRLMLNMNTCERRQCLEELMESAQVPRRRNTLKLSRGLRFVRRQFLNTTLRGKRRFSNPFVVVLVVDEKPSDFPRPVAAYLRFAGARIITVVYKQPNVSVLRAVSSKPVKENLFKFKFTSSLPVEGAAAITSVLCEEISNKQAIKDQKARRSNLKKSTRAKLPRQSLLRLKNVRSSSSSIRLSWKRPSYQPTEYRISHYPHHGVTWRINTTVIFENLLPSTIYKITIRPFFHSFPGLPTTFVFTTAPVASNISIDAHLVSRHRLQELLTQRDPSGVDIPFVNNITILDVTWTTGSAQFLYEVYTIPSTPALVHFPKKSNRRLFIDTSPGTQYTVYVETRLPRQERPMFSTASIITPPSPPVQINVHQDNFTSLTITWLSPQRGVFDSFLLMIESVYGRSIHIVETPKDSLNNPTRTNRSFSFSVNNILPLTSYRVKIYSRSRGILSGLYASVSHVTDAPRSETASNAENLHNSLLVSSSDGIYSFALGSLDSGRSDDDNSPSLKHILHVESGVVNAIYHRRLEENAMTQQQVNSWKEMVVWVDRKSREIKISTFGSKIRTTTLLSGLLQPVGLAIDNKDKNLYWTDIASNCVGVASLNYPGFPDEPTQRLNLRLISGGGMTTPISVAIDSVNRRLFWGDFIGRIEEAEMNGEGRRLLVNDTTLRPYALTYCIACKRLYWVNAMADRLESFGFDGSGHKVVLEEATGRTSGITFLTSFRNDLIWMNSETLQLKKSDELKLSKSDGSPNIYILDSALGIANVTSINAYDHLPYERAILGADNGATFPCSDGNHACAEVCISTSHSESFCTGQCYPWEMLCLNSGAMDGNRTCVSKLMACDGKADCPNREDEELRECSLSGTPPCQAFAAQHGVEAFQCIASQKCIPASSVCDGRIDCRDGSDEEGCPLQMQVCDFEEHLCLWTQESNDDFDWSFHNGRTPSKFTGPSMDHTLIATNSSYIYIEATNQDTGATAVLSSVWLTRPVCVKFFYHMLGTSIGSLSLMYRAMDSDSSNVEVWSKDGNHGVFWKTAQVSINYHGFYQLMFVATRGMDYRGDIALDDVTINDGLCDVSRTCAFEGYDDSVCGYELDDAGSAGWRLWSGPTPSLGTGPFPYNSHMEEVLEPELTSPLDSLGPEWFYFDFEYDDIPGCNVCNGTRLVRKLSDYDEPSLAGIILCESNKYKIFLGDDLHGTFRNIGDGLGTGDDHCEFIQTTSGEASEVGDYTKCQGDLGYVRRAWSEPVTKEPFGYGRAFGVSPAYYKCDLVIPREVIDNEPRKQKARLPNRYFYVESDGLEGGQKVSFAVPVFMTRKKSSSDDAAKEKSMDLPNSKNLLKTSSATKNVTQLIFSRWCLVFRYHMHGRDTGTLRLSVNEDTEIWSKEGDQSPNWRLAKVTIPSPTVKYNVLFTTTGGGGEAGDIAVDDVTIQEHPCHLPQSYTCEFDSHIVNECAFSIQPNPDKFAYIKVDKLFERQRFDPIVIENRVKSSGVLTYTGSTRSNERPSLQSPVLPFLSSFYPAYCLTVNYMQRLSNGTLSFVLRLVETGQSIELSAYHLPEVSNINPWLSMAVEVNPSLDLANTGPFILEFHGLEAIYVDSVSITTHPCPTFTEGFCNNAISCGNNLCVKPENLCDGFNDCGDWSDEVGCPSHCGNMADVFGEEHIFINASLQRGHNRDQCVWRIHGDTEKNILMDISVVDYSRKDRFTLTVYRDFIFRDSMDRNKSSLFRNETEIIFKNNFKKPSKYMIANSQATLVMKFTKRRSVALVSIRVSEVPDDHCNYLCPDFYCVTDNYECDGIPGCPDGSDETHCTRLNNSFGEKIFEVRRMDGDYSAICSDDLNTNIANAACIQEGFLKAEEPLKYTPLPADYKHLHKLQQPIAQNIPEFIQAHVVPTSNSLSPEKRNDNDNLCQSGNTWVADCVPYQCGVRSVRAMVNPILRIVGGTASKRGWWPWMVSLLVTEDDHKCGGILISDKFVLTAAHCFDFDDPDTFIVVIGANDLEPLDKDARVFTIKKANLHYNYDKLAGIPDWDIALLELNKPVIFSPFISPACLPGGDVRFRPGKKCFIVGYGHLKTRGSDPNRLFDVESPILSYQQCNQGNYAGNISPRMLCAGYPDEGQKGICFGDSGGPLVCEADDGRWTLAGIVSWSFGCALPANPDVFTNVQYFIEWLNNNADMDMQIPDFLKNGTCGGLFTESSGSISSPGWPGKYPRNAECTYRIIVGIGQTIRLSFETLATEGGHYDAVEVFLGGMHLNNSLGFYSGHYTDLSNLTFEMTGENIEVVFYSDGATSDLGFYAQYVINGTKEDYTGPVHPIMVSLGKGDATDLLGILLGFTGRYIPDGATVGGRPSYVQEEPILLLDGTTTQNILFFNESRGQWIFTNLNDESSGSYLFANDSAVTPDLAKVLWGVVTELIEVNTTLRVQASPDTPTAAETTALPTTAATTIPIEPITEPTTATTDSNCSFTLTGNKGEIISPGFPDGIAGPCKWRIMPNYGSNDTGPNRIVLVVDYFKTEGVLNFSSGNNGEPTLYSLTGAVFPDEAFLASYNTLSSSESVEGQSSSQTNSTENETEDSLESEETDAIDEVSSPSCADSATSFSNADCSDDTYTFFSSLNATNYLLDCDLLIKCSNISWCKLNMFLEANDLNLVPPPTLVRVVERFCQNSKRELTVISARVHSAGTASREQEPNDLEVQPASDASISSKKTVLFYEDVSREGIFLMLSDYASGLEGEGFFLRYLVEGEEDEAVYNEDEYTIVNLNPQDSHEVAKRAIPGFLSFFSLPPTTTQPLLSGNPFLFFASPVPSNLLLPPTPRSFNPPGAAVAVPVSLERGSARISISVAPSSSPPCARTTTLLDSSFSSWIITSPNFPEPYGVNINCTWIIATEVGHGIVLEFTDLLLEDHRTCNFDSVTLFDGATTQDQAIGSFCYDMFSAISVQESSGPAMTIYFLSDNVVTNKGFRATITSQILSYVEDDTMDPELFRCDFSHNNCGFTNQPATPDFTWTRHKFSTSSDNTGPNHDASSDRQGYYLFIEASSPRVAGDRASILSPTIPSKPDVPVCLRFAHDMYGATTGFLNVYVLVHLARNYSAATFEGDGTETVVSTKPLVYVYGIGVGEKEREMKNPNVTLQRYLLWSKYGEQRGASEEPWQQAAITFFPFNDFQIVFEGVRGFGYQSDIAIDNILMTDGECRDECELGEGYYKCSTVPEDSLSGECISMELVCDGKTDCRSGSDERRCISAIRNLCTSDSSIQPNSTAEVVCSDAVVDRCSLRSPFFTQVNNVVCDGVFDCFGGHDESQCSGQSEAQGEFTTVNHLNENCGYQIAEVEDEIKTDYPNASSSTHWPWVAGLYVATPSVDVVAVGEVGGDDEEEDVEEEEEEVDEETERSTSKLTGYTFLCSAVFIKPNWVVVAAHCLLNPDFYDDYVSASQSQTPQGSQSDMEEGFNELPELEEEAIEEGSQSEPQFSYAIITPNFPGSGASRSAWKVNKWILHPKYKSNSRKGASSLDENDTDDDDDDNDPSDENDAILEQLKADSSMINFDIALLKVEPDDDILLKGESVVVEVTEFVTDVEEVDTDDVYPIFHDTEMRNLNSTLEMETSSACLEVFETSTELGERGNTRHPEIDSGVFKLPLEEQRFGINVPSEGTSPRRATCVVVGHSPVSTGSSVEDDQRLVWSLRHLETPVTSADITSYFVFCDSYDNLQTRKKCVEALTTSTNTADAPHIHVLMRSGYNSKRAAGYVHDQGTVVLCRRYDKKWFLAGTYSWINLRRNFIAPDFKDYIQRGRASPGQTLPAVLSIPLGTDYFTKLTPSLNEWISETLQVACPGEYSCYPAESPINQCVTLDRVCDGIVDCSDNFADELDCDSGCFYDPMYDPFHQYYSQLREAKVIVPENIAPTDVEDEVGVNLSWRNDTRLEDGIQTIKINRVKENTPKSCHWSILPPPGKIAVLRVPKLNANPLLDGGLIQIVTGNERTVNDWSTGPHYYASLPDQPITFLLAANPDSKYLTEIRNFHFDYFVEDPTTCSERHRCGSGNCIAPNKVCDGELDCDDLSDEMNCPSGCEGLSLYHGVSEGRISSRSYPLPHTGNGDCTWVILASADTSSSSGRTITIEFSDFVTSPLDQLHVFAGVGKTKAIQEIYSTNLASFNISIPAEQATLLLRSNDGIAERRINGRFYISNNDEDINR